jgi:hypothetical protein
VSVNDRESIGAWVWLGIRDWNGNYPPLRKTRRGGLVSGRIVSWAIARLFFLHGKLESVFK